MSDKIEFSVYVDAFGSTDIRISIPVKPAMIYCEMKDVPVFTILNTAALEAVAILKGPDESKASE